MDVVHTHAATACIVGAGRLARALHVALPAAGIRVVGSWSRTSATADRARAVAGADVVFLAVPDRAVEQGLRDLAVAVAAGPSLQPAPLALVASGAIELAPLAGSYAPIARLHPLQVVTGGEGAAAFEGAAAAITAPRPADARHAAAIARRLGMRPVEIDDERAATWHAAATLAANSLTALLADAGALAVAAGLAPDAADEAITYLAASAIDQVRALGAADALTGPIVRGDEVTVARHRAALAADAPELLPTYDVLAERTRVLAARRAHPTHDRAVPA